MGKLVGYVIRSLLLMVLLGIIATIYTGLGFGIGSMTGDIFTTLLVALILYALVTWLTGYILGFIAYRNGVAYWLFALICAIVMLSYGLKGTMHDSIKSDFWYYFFLQMTATFFCIPKLDGEWNSYLNQETTYYSDNTTSYREWISDEYTPGWWSKLVGQAVFSLIVAIIANASETPNAALWIAFVLQAGFTGYLLILNFKAKFFY